MATRLHPAVHVNFRPPPWSFDIAKVLVHMLCVRLPISLTVRRWERGCLVPFGVSGRSW